MEPRMNLMKAFWKETLGNKKAEKIIKSAGVYAEKKNFQISSGQRYSQIIIFNWNFIKIQETAVNWEVNGKSQCLSMKLSEIS